MFRKYNYCKHKTYDTLVSYDIYQCFISQRRESSLG